MENGVQIDNQFDTLFLLLSNQSRKSVRKRIGLYLTPAKRLGINNNVFTSRTLFILNHKEIKVTLKDLISVKT
jgi:hypothetical protein